MKNLSKVTALAVSAALTLSLAACSGGNGETKPPVTTPPETTQPVAPSDPGAPTGQTYTVGICQLVQHEALDAATEGFIDAINEALPGQVTFDEQNASNDIPMCSTIIGQFVAAENDLILANATPALQAATAATTTIPILGTSVTEYGVALGIENFGGTVGGNVSGTSDLAPLDQQAAMVKEWFPEAATVGLVYCSAEPNSQYQVDVVQTELEKLGLTAKQYSFSDSNDLAAVVENAAANNDVLYVPTDNTVAANTGIIDNICRPAKIPVICGEEGIARGCGVATLSISYYDLGVATGKMAVKILTGESDIANMPVEYAPQFTPKYNPDICADLGLTAPEGYEAIDLG